MFVRKAWLTYTILCSTLFVSSCSSLRITQMPSANYGERVKSLVLHFTAIDYAQSVEALVNEGGLSAHYLVPESNDPSDPVGLPRIIQLVDESKRAWHAGQSYWQGRTGLNDHSIGVEIVNVPDCQHDDQLNPSKTEHGAHRLCLFPDYDAKQIAVVIELTTDILSRHPDIHPTAVVGHSDIAFDRKSDPGPRFPWYELYQAGIGAWYNNDTLARYWKMFNTRSPSIGLLQAALRAYGYGLTETGIPDRHTRNALAAFQMHFLPWQVSGEPDSQTSAAVFALLEKYFPAQATDLLARYQREGTVQAPVNTELKRGQIDTVVPELHTSERTDMADRFTFKSYRGRGELIVSASENATASIRVNGKLLNLDQPFVADTAYRYSLGRRTVDGLNTLAVDHLLPQTAKLSINVPFPKLVDNTSEFQQRFAEVDAAIKQDIQNGFPGAVLVVIKNGAVIKRTAYGYATRYDPQGELLTNPLPMHTDTVFDLASNTKTFATVLALMHLSATGEVDVTKPIQHYLPEYRGNGREARLVSDLLSHQSGYPSDVPFHHPDQLWDPNFYSLEKQSTAEIVINKIPFDISNGLISTYSDINFILLGMLVERITGMPLDQYCESQLYAPLALENTRFNPLQKGAQPERYAATELMGNTRGGRRSFPHVREYTLRGEVHDEKAFHALGGVAGHAGLFSTADELAVLAQLILNGGGYGDVKLFDSSIISRFTRPTGPTVDFGLGWQLAANPDNRWLFGPYASSQAFGHSGWTGTATVIDPTVDLAVILLTNARHSPIVEDEQGNIQFTGKSFKTGQYGSIVSLVYEAIFNH